MFDRSLNILIIEDTPTDVELMVRQLQKNKFDFTYHTVEMPEEIDSALKHHNFDLVISDFNLPGYTGIESLKRVKESDRTVPCIIVSGVINREQESMLLEQGANDVILKSHLNRLPYSIRRILYEFEDRKELQETKNKLQKDRNRLQQSQELARVFWWGYDPVENQVKWSNMLYELLEVTPDEFEGTFEAFYRLVHPEDRATLDKVMQDLQQTDEPIDYELRIGEGEQVTYLKCTAQAEFNEKREPIYIYGTSQDITNLKLKTKRLEDSLQERETLLKEIHHRVKNNLAIISSLLQMRQMESKDKEIRQIISEILLKIQSIALVHEHLYQKQEFSSINFGDFIEDLIQSVQKIASSREFVWNIESSVDSIDLNVNQAVPCGLIISELLMNAINHASGDNKKLKIHIDANQIDDKLSICVADNGEGLPEDFKFESNMSFGSTIVATLLQQLKADYSIRNTNGAEITFEFDKTQVTGGHSLMEL